MRVASRSPHPAAPRGRGANPLSPWERPGEGSSPHRRDQEHGDPRRDTHISGSPALLLPRPTPLARPEAPRLAALLDAVADDAIEGFEAVLDADLLALFVTSAAVGDADLVDPQPAVGDLGGDLRLEAESILLQLDALDHLPPEQLEAGLHVGEVEVGEGVAQRRE